MNKIKTISIKLVLPLAILLSYVIVFSIGYNVGWIQAGQECLSQMQDFLNVIHQLRERCP